MSRFGLVQGMNTKGIGVGLGWSKVCILKVGGRFGLVQGIYIKGIGVGLGWSKVCILKV